MVFHFALSAHVQILGYVFPLAFPPPAGNIGTGSNFFGDGLGDGFLGDGPLLAFGFDLSGVTGGSRCAFRLAFSFYCIVRIAFCYLSFSRFV